MIRKTLLAIAAVGTLGVAALAPTAASAWHFGHHHGHGFGFGGIVIAGPSYDSCMQQRWVDTRFGPRLRWVNVCY